MDPIQPIAARPPAVVPVTTAPPVARAEREAGRDRQSPRRRLPSGRPPRPAPEEPGDDQPHIDVSA